MHENRHELRLSVNLPLEYTIDSESIPYWRGEGNAHLIGSGTIINSTESGKFFLIELNKGIPTDSTNMEITLKLMCNKQLTQLLCKITRFNVTQKQLTVEVLGTKDNLAALNNINDCMSPLKMTINPVDFKNDKNDENDDYLSIDW